MMSATEVAQAIKMSMDHPYIQNMEVFK